jgi:predicted transposase YdaD
MLRAEGRVEGRAEGRAEGRVQGRVESKAEDILVVFEQRGIDIDDKSRELIESCTDLGVLNGWFRRAFKIDKASDLFEE